MGRLQKNKQEVDRKARNSVHELLNK